MQRYLMICCVLMSLAVHAFAQVEAWTNQAGHVVHAELVEYEAGIATLKTNQGTTVRIPLSTLCKKDQRRIRILQNESIVPEFVQVAYRDAKAILMRYEQLAGRWQDAGEREGACNMARAIFDERIAAHGSMDGDPAVQDEIIRLRNLLL